MGRKRFSYVGESYSQGSSNLELFSFCASANDIYSWGGVPAKTERFHGGFQRALSERHKKIKQFFDGGQASPTSIVVAFREGVLKTTALGFPHGWPETLNQEPRYAHITFEYEEASENDDIATLRNRVLEMIVPRLGSTDELDTEAVQDEASDDSNADESGNDDEYGDDESDELDVGRSKLRDFVNFIGSDEAVGKWLESENARHEALKKKAKLTKAQRVQLLTTPEQRLKSLLVSLLRPATIVDGQHRVWGAYHSDESPILFSVCAIKDISWIEQVFQFVVLNKLAKPISKSFLTGLLNTSLTNSEVTEIEKKLEDIGIKNTDRKIMKYLNHDKRSPFADMIAEAGEIAGVDNRGKLSDKGMLRLAKRWKNVARPSTEISMFKRAIKAKTTTEARKTWAEYETWFPYFYAFWKTIRDRYEKDDIWVKKEGFSLLYIVTMHVMQDMFLKSQSEADVEFDNIDDFRRRVAKYFQKVPGTFFTSWEATGLQSGDGPDHIKKAIKDLRAGANLSTVQDKSPLFQKSTPS